LGRKISHEANAASFARAVHGQFHGRVDAHHFHDHVGTFAPGEVSNFRKHVFVIRAQDRSSAQLEGEFESLIGEVNGKDCFATRSFQALHDKETNETCSHHDGGIPGLNARSVYRVKSDRDRFREGRFFVGNLVGKEVANAAGDENVVREGALAAEVGSRYPKHFTIIAEIDVAGFTVGALPAIDRAIEGDAIALGPGGDLRSALRDRAARFVPHHDGRDATPAAAVHAMNIAPADPTGPDLDEKVIWSRLGNRFFDKVQGGGVD